MAAGGVPSGHGRHILGSVADHTNRNGEKTMIKRIVASTVLSLLLSGVPDIATAQNWNAEQQEVWQLEEQQWKMAAAEDLTWIDTMVHPNVSYWETSQAMPQNRASLARWNRFNASNSSTLEQELFPISIVITGNIAVVNYYYQSARENLKQEREMVSGRYMDVLIKDGGRWKFIAWAGGDDPKK
jgi:Domain of unknown function (DUF4440)